MAIAFYELAGSRPVDRSVDSASVVRKWIATGSADENAVATALLLQAPSIYDTLPRTSFKLDPLGGGIWMCDVTYSLNANTQTDDPDTPEDPNDNTELGPESSFDLTAGSAHITQSLETKLRWKPGKVGDTPAGDAQALGTNATLTSFAYAPLSSVLTLDGYTWDPTHVGAILSISGPGFTMGQYTITTGAGATVTVAGKVGPRAGVNGGAWVITFGIGTGSATDLNQAIGVTFDSVEGTDIVVPKFEFSWAQQVYPVTLPYLRRLRSIVGKTNNAAWRGFDKGELLYLGATGSAAPGNVWKLVHKFAAGENLYAVRVTPNLVIPQKRAWEYLWCPYDYDTDTTKRYTKPTAAYVERVYQEADFTLIGLGK
jgi:hypothetical protein